VIVFTLRVLLRRLRGEKPRRGSIVTHVVQVYIQNGYLPRPSRNRYSLNKLTGVCLLILKILYSAVTHGFSVSVFEVNK
jgi:hypothetical protein